MSQRKSRIVIRDLKLPESLTPLSAKEQEGVRGGRLIEGDGPSKFKYSMQYVYPLEYRTGFIKV